MPWEKVEKAETPSGFGVSHAQPIVGAMEEFGCRERFGGDPGE